MERKGSEGREDKKISIGIGESPESLWVNQSSFNTQFERKGPEGREDKRRSPEILGIGDSPGAVWANQGSLPGSYQGSPNISPQGSPQGSPVIEIKSLPVELSGFEGRLNQITKDTIDNKYNGKVLLIFRISKNNDNLGAIWVPSEVASLGSIPLTFREFTKDVIEKLVTEHPSDLPDNGLLALSSFYKDQTVSFVEMLNTEKYIEKVTYERLLMADYVIPGNKDLIKLAITPFISY